MSAQNVRGRLIQATCPAPQHTIFTMTAQIRQCDATGVSDLVAAIRLINDSNSLGLCASCMNPVHGIRSAPSVRVVEISQVDAGWLAHGEIHNAYCESCGVAYQELIRYIPIVCAVFPCPACGAGPKLTPEILSINANESGYDFAASLKCSECSKERPLSKLLRGLSKITRVKVGPTGVEVEVRP
jgi:hypothetical protein